ncbi:hypothetical protein SAMN05421855_105124 [Ulvibacter litoralis]|uniref:Uncharacterized protein n=1 Tax=Ulvibacter litoralis TaxID=227084 RepID=A0A1G7I7T8_9FLAO|nr:hypothetical protein GCM10008083_29300 [Ulvibacter litoralis]SDF08439.1 hypothetical protein SAMN05421855_105124 [Ulvibacter litoralis]
MKIGNDIKISGAVSMDDEGNRTAVGDFVDYDGDGTVIFASRELPEPLSMPFTMCKESEAPHSVVNLSNTKSIRLIRVEMKQ